jgi:hypothetical protein
VWSNRIIDFPLTETQIRSLTERIDHPSGLIAADWGYVLARARHVDSERIITPVVERFKRAIREGKGPLPYYRGSYLDDDAYFLNGFTRVFPFLRQDIATPVLKREIGEAQDARARLWLMIAAGMNGDEGVGEELLRVVDAENENSSVRALALRAYARAVREKAIPLLQRYQGDKTPGPNPRRPPLDLVARDELSRLGVRPKEK